MSVHLQPQATIAFGPVPSRRLGRSVGINNIPPKICTYSCVYCQVGRTSRFRVEPEVFYEPRDVVRVVADRIAKSNEAVDYLTFVPDGEPTLDQNLGVTIELLKPLGIRIAVITNATLIDRQEVRTALRRADWVSLKVDSVHESTWRKTNRPHRQVRLAAMLEGMLEFRKDFSGTLVSETMLVSGLNDDAENLKSVAGFLARLEPEAAYLSIPIRPPAESWVRRSSEEAVAAAHQILGGAVPRVELLIGYEGNAFASSGDPEEDLLSITAVHPMREDAVGELLARTGADGSVVERLVERGMLVQAEYDGQSFFIRSFPKGTKSA